MNDIYCKLIENERLFVELSTKQFSDTTDVTEETVREVLSERGLEIRAIISETNEIIEKQINPLLNNPRNMSRAQAEELEELAGELSSYKSNVDTGLAYNIRHALTRYSRGVDDVFFIRNMFYKGITLFYLDTTLFKPDMNECYEEVISFSDRYAELDSGSKNIICRAYGNAYLSVEKIQIDELFRMYDRAVSFWTDTAKVVDPDFPLHIYLRNMHENLCAAVLTLLRSKDKHVVKQFHIKRLLESAEYLNDNFLEKQYPKSHDYTSAEIKYLYYVQTARYHNKVIDIVELTDYLYEMYSKSDDEYNYDNMYKKVHISALYLYYVNDVPIDKCPISKRIINVKKIENNVFNYIMNIPNDLEKNHVSTLLTNFALGSYYAFDDYAYLKMLLSMTVFRHTPTYVHSVMVAKIAFVIVEYIAKHYPEKLVGLPGINTPRDIEKYIGEILLFAWISGLVHDIGKISYSHLVSFYVRRLNDKEFEMIKQHSKKAEDFIKSSLEVDEINDLYADFSDTANEHFARNPKLFSRFMDIAMGHHKSFDGKFGYPAEFDNTSSPVKMIIDIITIADTIDAATDNIGRSYAQVKTLDHIEDEIMEQKGTRYSDFVADLIVNNSYLYDTINDTLKHHRYELYYSCFFANDVTDTMKPPKTTLF